MNILFLDQFGELGGAQRCLLDLMPAVLERGWSAYAAVPEGELGKRLAGLGVPVAGFDPGRYTQGRKTLGDAVRFAAATPRLAGRIRRMLQEREFDLVYANGPRVLPVAVLASSVPVLFHAHSFLPPGLSRRLAVMSLVWGEVMVVAVSRYVAGYLDGVPSDQVAVVSNGVADARRSSDHRGGKPPRIGMIGRISPEKGQLDFLHAARLLPASWEYVICGQAAFGSDNYAAEVRRATSGLPVKLLGWQEDIAGVLATLDLLVVPSLGDEGLGRVILEAFSAEVPVVAYPSGGIPEIVGDNETGFLTESRTAEALAGVIRGVMDNPDRRSQVATAARAAWESSYTLEIFRERITSIMALAAQRQRRPPVSKTGV